jgi:hypothetical protein
MVKAQDLFIEHITTIFEGDGLAAESIPLNITSSLIHHEPIPLGSLTMNIYSMSATFHSKRHILSPGSSPHHCGQKVVDRLPE